MRRAVLLIFLAIARVALIAQGYLPLSRAVEAPYAAGLHAYKASYHTAIRPYMEEEAHAAAPTDTSRVKSAIGLLDRWAMDSLPWKFRGGPLVDAQIAAPLDEKETVVHRASAGFWCDWSARRDLLFHADAQIWNEGLPHYLDTLVRSTHVAPGEGYAGVDSTGPWTHHDWNAFVDWKAPKYFRITAGRGKNFFGEGYRSLFLSDNATSYPYLRITTTAWHIRYVNLFTLLNDVRGADGDPSGFTRKFASFHYLSWNASERLNFSVFESIVWSNGDSPYPRGFDINYVNPVVVFRPQEFAQGSADNALLGFGASFKVGLRTLLYGQAMLDEFLLREVRAGNGWYANKQGFQLGVSSFDAFKVKGLFVRLEFNYVRPFMYTHSDTRQNYSHSGEPLAHPFGSNFHELLGQVEYRRDRWIGRLHISNSTLGMDTGLYSTGNNIFRTERERFEVGGVVDPDQKNYGHYLGDALSAQLFYCEIGAGWLVDPHTGTSIDASWTLRSRVPEGAMDEVANIFTFGITCRFRERYKDQEVRYVIP